MIIRKLSDKKLNVVLIQGSPRDKDTCPGMTSKTHKIVDYIVDKWSPFINFKVIDLSVNLDKKPIVQPCKGCISSAGGMHCHFGCDCYFKGDKEHPDLLHELDVYELLQSCDAFIVLSPIHWHSVSAQVKTLFDRLVCINLTLSRDDAKKILGDDIKNPNVTGKLHKSGKYNHLLRNHLEGKVAAFYVHGDDGANDYNDRDLPDSYNDVMNDGFQNNPKSTISPFIMQLKYSGVYVPDELIQAFYINKGVDYFTANLTLKKNKEFYDRADTLMNSLLSYFEKE
jgi:multimeric flavodoxin WrbA